MPTSVQSPLPVYRAQIIYHGSLDDPPFEFYHASPNGIVLKKEGSHRLILDQSDNHACPVNGVIDIEEFRNLKLATLDVRYAFCLCTVHPSEWHLLCFHWLGHIFLEYRLPFGLRSSPFIFNNFANDILWCIIFFIGLLAVIHSR